MPLLRSLEVDKRESKHVVVILGGTLGGCPGRHIKRERGDVRQTDRERERKQFVATLGWNPWERVRGISWREHLVATPENFPSDVV